MKTDGSRKLSVMQRKLPISQPKSFSRNPFLFIYPMSAGTRILWKVSTTARTIQSFVRGIDESKSLYSLKVMVTAKIKWLAISDPSLGLRFR